MRFLWPSTIAQTVAPGFRPKLVHLYYALAATILIVLAISMYLTRRIGRAYEQSLEVNNLWAERLDTFSQLFPLIAQAGDVGTGAAGPRDVRLARARLHAALDSLDVKLKVLETEVLSDADTITGQSLRRGLGEVRRTVAAAAGGTEGVLHRLALGAALSAEERAAALKPLYDEALQVTAVADAQAQHIQERLIREQLSAAQRLRRFEYLVAGLALVLVIGITDYGYRLDRHTQRHSRERDRLAEQLRQANEELERRVAERTVELEQAHEALRHAQKLEAIGRLAGGVAHDFNNILTAILGYSQFLLDTLPPSDDRRRDVEEIQRAGERASSLTRQLLAFSRKQILQFQAVDLNRVVGDMEKMLRRLIGEHIELVIRSEPALGTIRADPAQLEQVITNLAVNASDAMPQGGKVAVETANVELDEMYAQDHAPVAPGRYIMLAVSDTGSGMTPEVRAHLFEPFFTTKPLGEGTGLGLATVYGIVKQTEGYIWVYSEPGLGTTFKIYFPRIPEPAPTSEAGSAAQAAPSTGSETVLLVEDEEAVRVLARNALVRAGYRVLEARSGAEALRVVTGQGDVIHALVTDVVMPGMSGRQVAEAVRAHHPGIQVLYMSGYTDDTVLRHGVLGEGMPFLQKPFTPPALARKLREVLDASRRGQA